MLKVLCLHGKQQNKEILRTRLGRIPPKTKNIAQFIVVDAPHLDGFTTDNTQQVRTWFNRDDAGNIDSESLKASLEFLRSVWNDSGPFDGVLGFSMGGTVAAVMSSKAYSDMFPGLTFGMYIGSPDIPAKMLTALDLTEVSIPDGLRSLHIAGLADNVVAIESSRALVTRFHEPQVIEHEQGHCIPMKAEMLNQIVSFVTSCKRSE